MAFKLTELPPEITCKVIETAPPSDQAALCRTSRLFHALGVPILYREVDFTDYKSMQDFCSTVLANPSKFARLTRSFTVTISVYLRPLDDSVLLKLSDCFKALTRIEHISLEDYRLSKASRQLLLSGTFPYLVRCTVSLPTDGRWTSMLHADTVASFLIRHSTLESISICPNSDSDLELWPLTSPRIPMPNLQRLSAPPQLFSSLIDTRLKELNTSFYPSPPMSVAAMFAILGPLIRNDTPFVFSLDWCPDVAFEETVDYVLKHMPHIRTLQLEVVTVRLSLEEILECFASRLPRFTNLAFFSFSRVKLEVTFDPDEGADQIRPLLDACPTLQAFRVANNAWRKADRAWENFTIDEFVAMAGISFRD
ncbi:hypothetical protein K438DRAFT_1754839 [Mycena galopus ATCC 62051]|nr:hypothetical protein K438DRAFT_1754839 [Mycena galopus ATCC 62051]